MNYQGDEVKRLADKQGRFMDIQAAHIAVGIYVVSKETVAAGHTSGSFFEKDKHAFPETMTPERDYILLHKNLPYRDAAEIYRRSDIDTVLWRPMSRDERKSCKRADRKKRKF